jgi:hypothetical protein
MHGCSSVTSGPRLEPSLTFRKSDDRKSPRVSIGATVGIREQRFGGIFRGFFDKSGPWRSILSSEKHTLIKKVRWCAGRDLNPEPVD